MRTRTQAALWTGVVVASLGLHAVAFGGLGRGGWGTEGAPRKRKPATADFSVNERKPAAPPQAPKAVEQKQRVAIARPAKAVAAPPPAPAAPPPPEAPADFTGQTLTNDGAGEGGWASATGNGQKMDGPVGRPGARVIRRVVDADEGGAGPGPRVVGLADLSRAPAAPELAEALAAAYPADARAKGVGGKAVVKARITPEGQVRELAVVSESGAGFGAACEQTLRGSSWTPPLDRAGHPVSTFINYTCRFNVE